MPVRGDLGVGGVFQIEHVARLQVVGLAGEHAGPSRHDAEQRQADRPATPAAPGPALDDDCLTVTAAVTEQFGAMWLVAVTLKVPALGGAV